MENELTSISSTTKRRELQKHITFEKNEADKLHSEKQRYEKLFLSDTELAKYQKLQRELDALKRELRNKTRLLEQNATNFEEIRSALVRALIQKKEKVVS